MATYSSIKYSNTPTNSVTTADIADTTISVPKLSSTLDISGKTVTIPNTSVTNAMLAGSIDLTSKVTGALPIANGGLGLSSVTASQAVKVNSGATALEFGAVGGGLLQMKAFRKTSGYVQSSSTSEHTMAAPFDGSASITPSDSANYIYAECCFIIDHGTTWRSNKAFMQFSTNGGSSWTDFGMGACTSYGQSSMYGNTIWISAMIPNQSTTNAHLVRVRNDGHDSGNGKEYGSGDEGEDNSATTPRGTAYTLTLYEYNSSVASLVSES